MGHELAGSKIWIYMFYPLLLMFKTALIIYEILRHAITTGEVPFWNKILHFMMIETYKELHLGMWLLKQIFLATWFPATFSIRHFSMLIYLCLTPSNAPIHKGHDNPRKKGSRRERWKRKRCRNSWLQRDIHLCVQNVNDKFLIPYKFIEKRTNIHPPDCLIREMLMVLLVAASFAPCFTIGLMRIWSISFNNVLGFASKITNKWRGKMTETLKIFQFSIRNPLLTILNKCILPSHMKQNQCANRVAYTTVAHVFESAEDLESTLQSVSFDTDGVPCVVDNSANTHIWNDIRHMTNYKSIGNYNVATIGGENHVANGIGDVTLSWTDDGGKIHHNLLQNVLHFPDSPVNILSVTAFANQLDDDYGTSIKTMRKESVFEWSFGKFHRRIIHPKSNNLPQFMVNEGYDRFALFGRQIAQKDSTKIFILKVTREMEDNKTSNKSNNISPGVPLESAKTNHKDTNVTGDLAESASSGLATAKGKQATDI